MRLSNIALYDKNTTDFFDQGLGILSDAISSESTEAVQDNGNITYEMVLKYPIGGVLSDQLKLPNLIRAQESEDPNDFMIFEIYDYDEDDEGEMTVYAQAMPYRVLRLPFNDDSKFPTKYKNIQELMDYAVSRVTGFPSWFKITSDIIVANNLSFDAGNAQFENLGKFLDATLSLIDASVEYKWNRINILDSRGRDLSDIVLRDDKNTNGIKITGSYEKIINKVVPIIRNRNETTGEFEDGTHMGSVVTSKDPFKWIPYYAGVTASFDSQEEANNYISSNKLDNPAITVDVTPLMVDEDLTQVHTFDRITAYSTKLKYQDTLQVTTRVFDQLNAEVVSFKMGSIKKDINSTTSYTLSSLASEIARAQNTANGAARSADGKNTNYYTEATPANQIEGDLWFHKIDGKDVIQQYINGEWSTIVKDGMGGEIRSYVDQKMLENNDAMDKLHTDLESNAQIVTDNKQAVDDAMIKLNEDLTQAKSDLDQKMLENNDAMDKLHSDLESNTQTIKDNKQAVDDAMDKVNEDLTKAKTDAESAFQKSDDAVGKAQSAIEASGLASATANSANDAALAAKELATSTSNSFAEVKSQAGTAFEKAKSALEAANGASSTATKASQDVDSINGVIKTLATSESVDAVKGKVDKATSEIETIGGQMKQVYTKTETTNLLTPYATQTWAQNQITASATELNSTMTTVQQQVQNSAVGTNLLTGTAEFSPWSGDRQFFPNGYLGLTFAFEKDSDGDIAWHLSGTANGSGTVGSYSWKLAHAYPSTYAFSVSVKGTFANTTLAGFHVEGSSDITKSINWSSTYSRWVATGNVASGNGNAAVLYFNIKSGDTIDIWVKKYKLEKGSLATDWCPNPADNASVTALSKLSQTVDGFSGTFATKNDLEKTESKFKVTADGLNLITAVTGKNGEKVTQVIADVNNIKNTMTGENGYTTRLQTLEGFQTTATDNIKGLQTQQTLLSNQWTSVVGMGANLLPDGDFENDNINDTAMYWNSVGHVRANPVKTSQAVNTSNQCIEIPANSGNNDWVTKFLIPVKEGVRYKYQFMERWYSPDQVGTVIGYVFEYGADRKLITPVPIFSDSSPQNWHLMSGTYTVRAGVKYVALCVTYADGRNSGYINIDDVFFAEDVANNSMITQLQDQIDLRTTVAGKVTAALNLSNDGGGTVTIRGASLYVTADSHFDNASIQSAAIASLDATKITSGSISSDRLATTKLNADNITSGYISSERLATTKLNADNITSGSISADRIASTAINANNIKSGSINADLITSGSIRSERLATTKLNADNITSGSIAAERLATTKLNADNITSGSINAELITTGKLSADRIWGGTLNGYLMDIVNINANNITTGTISGANLAINLTTGEVTFQKGSIKSSNGRLNIDVDDGTFAQSDGTKGMLFAKGNLYLSSSSWWEGLSNPDAAPKPDYGFIGYGDTLMQARGFEVIGRDALILGLTDNDNPGMEYTSPPVIIMDRTGAALNFAGGLATIQAGREFTIKNTPFYSYGCTPGIQIGTNVDHTDGIGDRVFIDGSYVYVPSAYSRTASGSANLIVASDGALVRTSSASKYKSDIARFRSTEMAEKLIRLPQAHWYNKEDMKRYSENPDHYSVPKMDYGMIAEDIAGAGLEDLVSRGEDGELEDVRYDRMAAVLLPLIASMKQEIEELKGE